MSRSGADGQGTTPAAASRRRIAAFAALAMALGFAVSGCASWFVGKNYQYVKMQNPKTEDEVVCQGQFRSGGLFGKSTDISKDPCVTWYTRLGYEKE